MRDAVTSLAERIGPSRRFFMVTPDPAAPQLSLSPVAERDAEGVRELKGLYFGELALLEDVARDSPRSLTRIMGGVTQARVADLRHALAGYFCVPESQLDVRSEEHTSELQSLMRISYAVFCLKKKIANI